MTDGQVLEFSHATKRFGVLTAVDDLSARIEPGAVTAFLGPNGAGKTTSLRMMLGQIRPSSGTATIGGVPHSELRHPLRTIGSVLEEAVYRPRRTAYRQLTIAAKANGIPLSRVDEVLALVGLQNETETRIGGYSLGMRQRLSVAGALLGDPGALVLDEPANGLDPEGIRWMRLLMRRLADEGRTVLVSSHVLSEIEQIADNVLVLSKGRLVYADSIGSLSDPTTGSVVVDADDRAALAAALRNAGLSFDVLRSGLTAHNTDAATVGAIAASAGLALTALQQRGPSLEEVFLDIVHGRRAPHTGAIPIVAAPDAAAGGPDASAEGAGPDAIPASDADAPATEADAADAGSAEASEDAAAPGLFGAAAATVPAVTVTGAGIAALFGSGASEPGATAFPTTRREAAEFAAAQSASAEAAGEDGAPADGTAPEEGPAAGFAPSDEGSEGSPDESGDADMAGDETVSDAQDQDASADGSGQDESGDAEAGEDGSESGEDVAAAGSDEHDDAAGTDAEHEGGEAFEADGEPAEAERESGEADGEAGGLGETDGSADSDGSAEPDAADDDSAAEQDAATDAHGEDATDAAADETAADASAEHASDAAGYAGSEWAAEAPQDEHGAETTGEGDSGSAESAESAEGSGDEGEDAGDATTAIAAGIALTAPIVADYTPGEAGQHDAEDAEDGAADADGGDAGDADAGEEAEQGSPLTHAADSDESGAALGSFATAALTLPDAAPAISFDDLITGIPAGVQSPAAGEDRTEDQDEIDDAPTAATTVISTPAAEDAFTAPEPSTETTEIAGIEIFAALAEGRTQEIQVILDETPDEDDLEEDVTRGEIHQDEDPRAAAVSASLAAAARAFYSDEAPSYTPGPVEEAHPAEEAHRGEQDREGDHHDGAQNAAEEQHGEDEHGAPHGEGDRHDGEHHDQHEEQHGH